MNPPPPNPLFSFVSRHAGAIAAVLCAAAGIAFAIPVDGYSHLRYPLAMLGAKAMPRALPFNMLAFVIPGLLVAVGALQLRSALPSAASWLARIGAQLILLSALAFAAQGLLPLDLADMEGLISGRHATVWMLWWLAYVTGGGLLALGLHRWPAWQFFAAATMLAAAMVPMFVLFVSQLLPPGLAQRIAFAIWFAWAIAADHVVRRKAQP